MLCFSERKLAKTEILEVSTAALLLIKLGQAEDVSMFII